MQFSVQVSELPVMEQVCSHEAKLLKHTSLHGAFPLLKQNSPHNVALPLLKQPDAHSGAFPLLKQFSVQNERHPRQNTILYRK